MHLHALNVSHVPCMEARISSRALGVSHHCCFHAPMSRSFIPSCRLVFRAIPTVHKLLDRRNVHNPVVQMLYKFRHLVHEECLVRVHGASRQARYSRLWYTIEHVSKHGRPYVLMHMGHFCIQTRIYESCIRMCGSLRLIMRRPFQVTYTPLVHVLEYMGLRANHVRNALIDGAQLSIRHDTCDF